MIRCLPGMLFMSIVCFLFNCNKEEKSSWYLAKCDLLCDEEKGKFLAQDKIEKYPKWYPYDTIQYEKGDSVIISFDLITDCCLDFKGDVDLKSDTLVLQYGMANDTLYPCDCYCDYRMTYRIDKKNKNWLAMKIVNADGHKIYWRGASRK